MFPSFPESLESTQ